MITDVVTVQSSRVKTQIIKFRVQCSKDKSFLLRNSQEYFIFAKNNSLPSISELIDILED